MRYRRFIYHRGGKPVPAAGVVLGLWWLLSSACATPLPATAPTSWACDPRLDAMVVREEWEAALEGHQALLRRDPGACLAYYHLGYIWGRLGDRAREIVAYEQAVDCGYDQDDRLYFNLGMALGDLQDLDAAVGALQAAVRLNRDSGDNHFGLALIYIAAGRRDDAERALQKALAVDPKHLEARLELARLCLDQRRWDQARGHLEAVQAMDPGNHEARQLLHLLESRRAADYQR